MRPAVALVYLVSVARVAAIEYGYPPVKSTSSFIDVNPVSVGDGILTQFEKKIKWANLTSDLPTPVASTSAPLSTCSDGGSRPGLEGRRAQGGDGAPTAEMRFRIKAAPCVLERGRLPSTGCDPGRLLTRPCVAALLPRCLAGVSVGRRGHSL